MRNPSVVSANARSASGVKYRCTSSRPVTTMLWSSLVRVIERLISRRRLLGTTSAGATASVLAGTAAELAAPSPASAQTVKSPAEALQALMDGNQRFVERKLTFYQEDL